jgi:cytochrome c553
MKKIILCFLLLSSAKTLANSVSEGEIIAKQGTTNGATACMACHGLKEKENLTGAFPRLAGQSEMYLENQLKDYASGARENAVMSPIAKALTENERANVAAYYSDAVQEKRKIEKKSDAKLIKRGELLARLGDQKIQVQACNNCHGPSGIGMAPAIPRLAGQFKEYTATQLKNWKTDKRKNSNVQMSVVAKKLSEQDIAAVAAYFEQVVGK